MKSYIQIFSQLSLNMRVELSTNWLMDSYQMTAKLLFKPVVTAYISLDKNSIIRACDRTIPVQLQHDHLFRTVRY